MKSQYEYEGSISISRYTGGEKGTGITIILRDELSGTRCVEIELSAETLGNALTGLSQLPCTFDWRPDAVGKRCEHKQELIEFQAKDYKTREQEARAALVPYETDGWKGSWRDLCNHHCTSAGKQRVGFTRYVKSMNP